MINEKKNSNGIKNLKLISFIWTNFLMVKDLNFDPRLLNLIRYAAISSGLFIWNIKVG